MKPEDIRHLSKEELETFLASFVTIITDCDGVLWLNESPIKGAFETLKALERLGKNVVFASNNSMRSIEDYIKKFERMGYKATADQILLPSQAIVWHLNRIGFKGKAFVVGTEAFLQVLRDAGFNIVTGPNYIEESLRAVYNVLTEETDVDAVIIDLDINLNWIKLTQIATLLQRDDVLFFTGPRDKKIPAFEAMSIIGPGIFVDILANHTGKTPVEFAKPSEILKNLLFDRYAITDPKKFIFVGDSLAADVKFADLCGFKKLWVSSGVDQMDSINDCEVIPDYYLPNLGTLLPLVKHLNDNETKDKK